MAWTEEQNQAIFESGKDILVSAGAGSGKTAVLTARVMRIIESGVHINELLVLTFTKAAAAEMKERIRKALKKKVLDNPKLKQELELIDQAYITTFDSFALSVVKKYHYLLNISREISITEESIIEMEKVKIMDEVFDRYYDMEEEGFKKLIYDFCVKDDNELKKLIIKIATKIDGLPNRDEYLSSYMDNYFSEDYIKSCLKEYADLLNIKVVNIKRLALKLSGYLDSEYELKLSLALSPLYNSKLIDDYYNAISVIKLPNLPRGSEDEVKKAKENLSKEVKNLKDLIYTYGNEKRILESIDSIKVYTQVIVQIVKNYLEAFHLYKYKNDIYDFQDIALLSLKVLKENRVVREALKNSFYEIMIDEYQDTNDIQENFIEMIKNNNVYMVGDIKQSIYRFRNANPYIFKSKYDNFAQNIGGLKIDLVKNFRSRKEVLENINIVFNLIMDETIGGAKYRESHQMIFGNNSYIEEGNTGYKYDFKILEYESVNENNFTKEEIEIFTIAKDIKDKIMSKYQVFDKDEKILRDITYNDFVILMDRASDFDLYKKIFEFLGIPLTLYKDDKINNSDDIYILKNIIDFVVKINLGEYDTKFKYDFVSLARSYLFELSDDEIFKCFKNNNFKDNIVYLSLKDLALSVTNSNINDFLEMIIDKTHMYEKFIKVGNIESAMVRISKLYDVANNLGDLGYDIYTFRDYLSELLNSDCEMKYSSVSNQADTVKIMTIHKSKGLEYHICYYSGLYKSFNIKELNDRFLFDNTYGIITPYFKEGINESFLKCLVKYKYFNEEISEKIRLFYVALSRAKEMMILLTPKCSGVECELTDNVVDLSYRQNYRSFSDILNSIKDKLLDYYEEVSLESLELTKDYLYSNKDLEKYFEGNSQEFIVKEIDNLESEEIKKEHFHKDFNELIDKEVKNNIEFGLMMHEALEYIDFKNPDLSCIENEFIKNKVDQFLNNDLLKDIDKAKVYKEYEFIYNNQSSEYHGIIDLMLEYDDRIIIIDYKLSDIALDKYLDQLKGYRTYIERLSSKQVDIYLYSILKGNLKKVL